MSKLITRRKFTLGSAAFAASSSVLAGKTKKSYDVVVIGAGISGLNTAAMLHDFGFKVLVLEAGSRVGGRIHTVNTQIGNIDVGASQVGNSYARVISACKRYGLRLVPEDRDLLDFGMHYQNNWINPETWVSNPLNKCKDEERHIPPMLMGRSVVSKYNPLESLSDWLEPGFKDWDVSLRTLMQREGYSEQAIDLARWSVPGISIDDTSLLRMFQEEKRGEYERNFNPRGNKTREAQHPFGEANVRDEESSWAAIYNIKGGCQRLPEAMAKGIIDSIHMNKKVVAIDMQKASATVKCEDGGSYEASFVVSTLPFSVLRSVNITGEYKPLTRQAISTMPYANTARMYLQVEKPFWEEDGLSPSFSTDGPIGMFWAIDKKQSSMPQRAMVVLVGESGRQISTKKNPEDFIIQELERLRPASKGLFTKLTYKDWAADPLQRGCGFSLAAGQVNDFARDMIRPWQRLYFAGEHTRRYDFGMEAALESSERVVSEILSASA